MSEAVPVRKVEESVDEVLVCASASWSGCGLGEDDGNFIARGVVIVEVVWIIHDEIYYLGDRDAVLEMLQARVGIGGLVSGAQGHGCLERIVLLRDCALGNMEENALVIVANLRILELAC